MLEESEELREELQAIDDNRIKVSIRVRVEELLGQVAGYMKKEVQRQREET